MRRPNDTRMQHARATRRRERREDCGGYGCEPILSRACDCCGSATVLVRCPECGDGMIVCDCNPSVVAFDCYVHADGRCAQCRPRKDDASDGLTVVHLKPRVPRRRPAPKGGA